MKIRYGRYGGSPFFPWVLVALLIVSCSGSPPVLNQVYFQRNYYYGTDKKASHSLGMFINIDDPDGKGDIETIYLINDDLELFWKIDKTLWLEKNLDNDVWLGANDFVMPSGNDFPGGKYRVIVIDKGGERDKGEFYLPVAEAVSVIPSLKYTDNGFFVVKSIYKENYLWLRDSDGVIVKRMKVAPGKIAEELVLKGVKEKIKTVLLYSINPAKASGYYSLISVEN